MIDYPIATLNDNLLYHFTSAESLIKILESMTLKMSRFNNLNDLNEKELNFSSYDWSNILKLKKHIVEHCSLISFSQNFQNEGQFCQYGFNHPRMWAQYANNNQGACTAINEDSLRKENHTILSNIFYKIEDVSYHPFIKTDEIKQNVDPEIFLKTNYKKLFFTKQNDWIQEDERRLLCIDGPDFLSINNCIEGICLGKNFSDNDYEALFKLLIDSMEKVNAKLTPHHFTFQLNQNGKVLAIDNSRGIIEGVRCKGDNANKYLSYLKENGY